nr:uncharacterized protein LOC111847479 [Paramormyrops kingsleyae]
MSTRGRTSPPPPGPGPLGTSTAPMTVRTWPAYCFGFILTSELFVWHVTGLQCYACNVGSTRKTIDVGCFHPEVVTCSQSHKGFKHRFCIKTENSKSIAGPAARPTPGSQQALGSGLLLWDTRMFGVRLFDHLDAGCHEGVPANILHECVPLIDARVAGDPTHAGNFQIDSGDPGSARLLIASSTPPPTRRKHGSQLRPEVNEAQSRPRKVSGISLLIGCLSFLSRFARRKGTGDAG